MAMSAAATKVIRIELDNFGPDAFEVISFTATEGISKLFTYAVTLAAKDPITDFDEVLTGKAHLYFGDPAQHIHGMVSSVQQGYDGTWQAGTGKKNRVDLVIVPDMWKLTLTVRTKFFRDMSVPDILNEVLADHGLNLTTDLSGTHNPHPSVLQYQESDFDFIQRLCEHEGIHFHFQHQDSEETIVFADHNGSFKALEMDLPLKPPKALEGKANMGAWGEEATISRFQGRQRFVSKKVVLQDYNDQTPSKDLKVEKEAEGKGSDGSVFMMAEHYKDSNQGTSLSKLRAEEILARKRVFYGASNAHRLQGGSIFALAETDEASVAGKYVVTEFHSEGGQPVEYAGRGGFHYANSFTCIPEDVLFRPEATTPWPDMQGLFHAKILGSGDYANVEEQGRYKVQFLFDLDGKGSIPVRLMEPYVGADYGFHAPLHEGVEVLVGFEYGHPDRPIIVAAAHNPEHPNTVKDANNPQSVFRSAGNNELRFDDTKGDEEVFLHGQKDWQIKIENDKEQYIGNDEKLEVIANRTKTIGKNQEERITENKTTEVGGDHAESIGKSQSITVSSNKSEQVGINSSETVGAAKELSVGGAYQITVGAAMNTTVGAAKGVEVGGNHTVQIGGTSSETVKKARKIVVKDNSSQEVEKEYSLKAKKKLLIESDEEIILKAGSASITLKKDGTIIIDGKDLTAKASGAFEAKASKDVTLKGSKVLAN